MWCPAICVVYIVASHGIKVRGGGGSIVILSFVFVSTFKTPVNYILEHLKLWTEFAVERPPCVFLRWYPPVNPIGDRAKQPPQMLLPLLLLSFFVCYVVLGCGGLCIYLKIFCLVCYWPFFALALILLLACIKGKGRYLWCGCCHISCVIIIIIVIIILTHDPFHQTRVTFAAAHATKTGDSAEAL